MHYKKWGLNFQEIWYSATPPEKSADVVVCFQSPAAGTGVQWIPKQTILIDLRANEADIFSGLKKDTRGEIRRAERDGVVCQVLNEKDPSKIADFLDFYDAFALGKGLEKISRKRFGSMLRHDQIRITVARDSAGNVLVYHVYRCGQSRARLLFSASALPGVEKRDQRSLIGRANRLLHWNDIRLFSSENMDSYDFGGWYAGSTDEGRLRINKFKEEFGGRRVQEFDAIFGVSIPGKIALALKRIFSRN